MVAGEDSSGNAFDDLFVLKVKENQWTKPRVVGNPPSARACLTLSSVASGLILHGGRVFLVFQAF